MKNKTNQLTKEEAEKLIKAANVIFKSEIENFVNRKLSESSNSYASKQHTHSEYQASGNFVHVEEFSPMVKKIFKQEADKILPKRVDFSVVGFVVFLISLGFLFWGLSYIHVAVSLVMIGLVLFIAGIATAITGHKDDDDDKKKNVIKYEGNQKLYF